MKGVVILKDSPTVDNPHRFIQQFTVELKVNVGWNTGNWFSRGMGSMTNGYATLVIEKHFIEKVNDLPTFYLNFISSEGIVQKD
jgi:hypothetical protein